MENSFVLPALVARRAEMAGELEKAQARVRQFYADLASLDAVIRQFDPTHPIDAIQAKHRRTPAGEEFAAMSRAVLGVLRRAGRPMMTPEIADRVIAERGLEAGNKAVRASMVNRVGRALRDQRDNDVARIVRRVGKCAIWELAG